jgi:branched-chain amino acid transport system ATP-binding protein
MIKIFISKSVKYVFFAVLLLLPLIDNNPYHLRLATTIGLYTILALGLNVLVGLSGLLDMGYIAFFAVGAYTYALLASPQFGIHLPFVMVLPMAAGFAVVLSLVIGLPTLRLRGDYLAIVTMGFAEINRILLQNLDRPFNITNGPNGIVQIDPPAVGGVKFLTASSYYYLIMFFAGAAYVIYTMLNRSQIGLRWRALKDDTIAAASFGINVSLFRVLAFAVGSVFAGVAGVLFAGWQSAVFPQNFTLNELITLYCMVILGGVGNPAGAALGVSVLIVIPELLRGYSIYRMIIYGLVLVVMMIYRPQGILPAKPLQPRLKVLPTNKKIKLFASKINTENVLEACNISKRFGGLTALSGVSFTLKKGEVLSIIGPNGAGKTTLINILTGVNKPSDGEFFLDGEKISGLKPHQIYMKGLSRTFQNLRLFNNMTVIENVMVGLPQKDYDRAAIALEFLGTELSQKRDMLAENLSYAYRKTLEIARAIVSNPKVVLLDEPAAGMNPVEVEMLMGRINALKKLGYSIVLVEHQMPLVMGISDNIIVLDQGQKIAEGPPEEIRQNPLVTQVYLGDGSNAKPKPKNKVVNMCEGKPLLELKGLEASYGHIRALPGIDLSVRRGEIVSLLGSNGAGKTTTIKTVLGSLKPDKGSVFYKGKDITGISPSETVKMGLGIVPEGRRVFARMTVDENLDIGASCSENKQAAKNKEYVFSLFPRLKERRNQKAGTLSGGEQQMLAMGRALMTEPELLLLDEPSMGLAPIVVDKIFETIQELNLKGTTILMVEQNANRALEVADRGYVLKNGRIVVEGTSGRLLEDTELKTAYLG